MTDSLTKFSPRKTARIAGVLYLVIFIVYPLAAFIGKDSIVVYGDPEATASNILTSESLFRIGLAGEVTIILVEVILAAILYELLKRVNPAVSLAAAFSRLAEGLIMAVNLLPSILALLLVRGAGYVMAIDLETRNALLMLFMDAFNSMIFVWGFFFGFHLLLLGYLVYKSGFFPQILGILLMLAGVGYLIQSFGMFVWPDSAGLYQTIVMITAIPGELAFTLYLLIKGLNVEMWEKLRFESA
jgi:hypothetical protein